MAAPGSSGQVGQTISGTISGLVEGSNDGTGLTVTVDSTPTGELQGGGWNFVDTGLGGDAYNVSKIKVEVITVQFAQVKGEYQR